MTSTAPYTPSSTSQKNGLALASLILGIVAITFILNLLLLPSIIGLILGIIGFQRAAVRGRRGMALAGIILSGIALLIGLLVGIIGIAGAANSTTSLRDVTSEPQTVASETAEDDPSSDAASEPAAEPTTEAPTLTLSEQNAVRSAESYIRSGSFSKSGLIEQLEYEDFTKKEATFAVEYIKPDYNTEADEAAASYLKSSSFSRTELKNQLDYEGFTSKQIAHGLDAVGY